MVRNSVGIIVGYAIFVFTSLTFFKLSSRAPHADPSISFAIITAIYGIICSFISGFAAKAISGSGKLTVNYILAFIIAGFAAFSFFKSEGNHWTQILAIFLFAPASIAGGYMRYNVKR